MIIYKELQDAYCYFNKMLFNNECSSVLITLQRQANTMGYISYNRFANVNNDDYIHELALNPEYFGVKPIVEIFQTMVHEMCHLVIYLRGQDTRKTYHNTYWAELMESVGLMPSNTGRVGGRKTGQKMADYPISDGLFISACNDLISNGTVVTWYDRFKPKNTTLEQLHSDFNFINMILDNKADEGLLKIPIMQKIRNNSAELNINNSAELNINNSAELNINNSANSAESSVKKPSKIKYTCECGFNIWGKSGLRIECLDCKKSYIEK